jgi:hypothetical protein
MVVKLGIIFADVGVRPGSASFPEGLGRTAGTLRRQAVKSTPAARRVRMVFQDRKVPNDVMM